MDYIPETLFDVIQHSHGVGEDTGRFFFKQFLEALEYLQKNEVVQRDLKLENILVDTNQMQLRVTDFGCAEYYHPNNEKSSKGTEIYMAPEIMKGEEYDGYKVDIFAMGVVLYLIVDGIFPFHSAVREEDRFFNLLTSSNSDKNKMYWKELGSESLSENFKDLFSSMTAYNPAERPSLSEIKNHPWVLTYAN